MISETCIAPVNIAVIKYWGKRDENLILPINDSLSMTLSTDQMCAKTTAAVSSTFKKSKMWLNGEEVPFVENPRIARCLQLLKSMVWSKGSERFPVDWNIHIASENNFPTAAGLASSAAGYACLIYTLGVLYGLDGEDLSKVARQGSGSACRSMYGGFVEWLKGTRNDGKDSIAVQVQPCSHWSEMHVLILVVSDDRKKTSSTKGMLTSVQTSDLIKYRAEKCVPDRITAIKRAINEKDFELFAEITMKDSNQFHAICLDTYPPCVYMNDISHAIVNFVHNYNKMVGGLRIAYTFDAGPNACLYLLEEEVPRALASLNKAFPNDNAVNVEYIKGIHVDLNNLSEEDVKVSQSFTPVGKNLLSYVIHTKNGEGPQVLSSDQSLLNGAGLPKFIQ